MILLRSLQLKIFYGSMFTLVVNEHISISRLQKSPYFPIVRRGFPSPQEILHNQVGREYQCASKILNDTRNKCEGMNLYWNTCSSVR